MSQRWAIWLAVDGDLRFGSHHDLMRSCQRMAVRAGLALHYSQGFNPHPALSLACPRPVGVASRDDLLVVTLDEPVSSVDLIGQLQHAAPKGMAILGARELPAKATPQPAQSHYELPLDADTVEPVAQAVADHDSQDAWPVERRAKKSPRQRRNAPATRMIDIKPSVVELVVDEAALRFTIRHQQRGTAKPGEILGMVGLGEATLAKLIRTRIEYTVGDTPGDFRQAEMKEQYDVTRNAD